MKDACEICHGESGGVPGNENIKDGVVMCDYCSSKSLPVAPAPTASAIKWADGIEKKYGNCCGDVVNIHASELAEEVEAYASSQSSKLEGVGQEAAEKIATYISQISNQSPVRSRSQATQEFAAIIDELIAGRLKP